MPIDPTARPSSIPRLVVDDVSVRYGDLVAVDHVDLEVAAGEVVALLGPSGCGKSSLLNAIAGLVPHAGTVRIDGTDVSGSRPDQRRLGLMFQSGALFPHLDVAGNVAFGLRMQGLDADTAQARVVEVLELVGLAGLGGRRVQELSGGQAQRVALARAIAPQPRLLLLDEPLSSLDRRLRDRLLVELPDVFAAVDAAVVHVTHDQDEAMALADRVVVMDRGHVAAVDTPTGLWGDPGSVFVAEFLGWPNVLPVDDPATRSLVPDRVRAAHDSDIGAIGVDAGRVHLVVEDPPDQLPAGGPRTAGHPAADETLARGLVTSRRFAGDHARVTVDLADHDVTLVATGPVHVMPGPGDHVRATIRDHAWTPLTAG